MKWFKVHNDIINDPKIRALSFEDRWHFVALMALTNDGTLDEEPEVRDVLVEVALGVHGVDLAGVKNRLMRLRLIGDDWQPLQWEWRQAGGDPAHTLRQRKYRESLKKRKGDVTRDARVVEKVTVEVEVEVEEEKEGAKKRARFAPPSVDQVREYAQEKAPTVDPNTFVDFYESKGWMVGSNKMKDWKAAVRQWHTRNQGESKKAQGRTRSYG